MHGATNIQIISTPIVFLLLLSIDIPTVGQRRTKKHI